MDGGSTGSGSQERAGPGGTGSDLWCCNVPGRGRMCGYRSGNSVCFDSDLRECLPCERSGGGRPTVAGDPPPPYGPTGTQDPERPKGRPTVPGDPPTGEPQPPECPPGCLTLAMSCQTCLTLAVIGAEGNHREFLRRLNACLAGSCGDYATNCASNPLCPTLTMPSIPTGTAGTGGGGDPEPKKAGCCVAVLCRPTHSWLGLETHCLVAVFHCDGGMSTYEDGPGAIGGQSINNTRIYRDATVIPEEFRPALMSTGGAACIPAQPGQPASCFTTVAIKCADCESGKADPCVAKVNNSTVSQWPHIHEGWFPTGPNCRTFACWAGQLGGVPIRDRGLRGVEGPQGLFPPPYSAPPAWPSPTPMQDTFGSPWGRR